MSVSRLKPNLPEVAELRFSQRDCDSAIYETLIRQNVHPVAARVAAGRMNRRDHPDPAGILNASLKHLDNPDRLSDAIKAAERIALSVILDEPVAAVCDHDMDGSGSSAVIYRALTEIFGKNPRDVHVVNTHRLKEGYGVSDAVVDRVLALDPRPHVVITADQGSSDEQGIARLADHGIDVIVSDHHLHAGQGPSRAYAFVNPQRSDCDYPDKHIAGGMVAWLLMVLTRRILVQDYQYKIDDQHLLELLDYVAACTLVDSVDMTSKNNRAVTRYGLSLINQTPRPCWSALDEIRNGEGPVNSETITYYFSPTLTSRGRLDESQTGVKLLLCDDLPEARQFARLLSKENEDRKRIEKCMTDELMRQALDQVQRGRSSACLYSDESHIGVQGIVCSRIGEALGVPVISFGQSFKDQEVLTGSCRAILASVNVKQVLYRIAQELPDVVLHHGGHAMAAGISIKKSGYQQFQRAWHARMSAALKDIPIGPTIYHDGSLNEDEMNEDTFMALDDLEPFGKGFERPTFVDGFVISRLKGIGEGGVHLRMQLQTLQSSWPAVWFNARKEDEPCPIKNGQYAVFAYQPTRNYYRGACQWQLLIRGVSLSY